MNGTKEVGKYNVDYKGDIWDGKIKYEMVGIQEFNGDIPVGNEKILYFLLEKDCIIPDLETEEEVERLLVYENYTKLIVRQQIVGWEGLRWGGLRI